MTSTTDIENSKLNIISWIQRTDSKKLLSKMEALRLNEFDHENELTDDQKKAIIEAISTLEE